MSQESMKSKTKGTLERFAGKGLYPPSLSWMLLLPLRNIYLSPKKLAQRLSLQKDSIVLEIGCGPGYFSPTIARMIPEGKLYLSDVQPEMIQKANKRLTIKGLKNFEAKPGDGRSLNFPDSSIDIIFLVTVFGEMEDRKGMVAEMHRVLKIGGLLSISEQGGDPDALTLEELQGALEPAGFSLEKVFGRRRTFTANFRK